MIGDGSVQRAQLEKAGEILMRMGYRWDMMVMDWVLDSGNTEFSEHLGRPVTYSEEI